MRALQISAYGAPLALNEVPRPVPAGRQVLVRVTHCGMCHSDLHIHSGGFALGGGQTQSVADSHTLPHTLGHEIEGTLAEAGPDAILPPGMPIGTRVAVYPWIGCGHCPSCRRGEENICATQAALGVHTAGGYADYVLVPEARFLLPAGDLAPGHAGLLMCSGLTAYAALVRMRLTDPYEPWLMLGAGGLGLTALQLADALDLAPPHVIDPSPQARAAAMAEGAASVSDPEDADALAAAIAATQIGFSAVVDFVGSEATLAQALPSLRKGGACVVVGLYGGLLTMPILQLAGHQLRLEGSYTGTLGQARDLLDLAARVNLRPIPILECKLAEGNAALDDLRERHVVGRVVLTP